MQHILTSSPFTTAGQNSELWSHRQHCICGGAHVCVCMFMFILAYAKINVLQRHKLTYLMPKTYNVYSKK